jgi:hypothetical protein
MALWQRPRRGTGNLSFFAPAAVKVTTTPNARLRQRRGAAVWGAPVAVIGAVRTFS